MPFGYLEIPDRFEFDRARKDMADGEWVEAERRLLRLLEKYPEQLDLGFALQDLRAELLARDLWDPKIQPEVGIGEAPSIAGVSSEPIADAPPMKAPQVLSTYYARELGRSPSVPNLVLAARVQSDPDQALAWLNQALDLDPSCAWALYGKAHALLQLRDQYRWRNARGALDAAIALDPSHILARRMEAWMLAQEGAAEPAAVAMERWLIATEFDPRVNKESRVEVRLDLARVWLSMGAVDPALRELQSLEGERVGRARRLLLLAAALTENGDVDGALDAARRASMIPNVGVLPSVQEALLREHWLGDQGRALELWEQVLAEAEKGSDPALLLQAFRARVVLERVQSEQEAKAAAEALAAKEQNEDGQGSLESQPSIPPGSDPIGAEGSKSDGSDRDS